MYKFIIITYIYIFYFLGRICISEISFLKIWLLKISLCFAVVSAMKIDVAELKKEAKRRSKKQTSQGPLKGKAPKAESSSRAAPKDVGSRPAGGVKIGRSPRSTSAHKEAERQLPRTEEEGEEDPAAQLVHRKRKWSEGGLSHSEARASRDLSGGSALRAP